MANQSGPSKTKSSEPEISSSSHYTILHDEVLKKGGHSNTDVMIEASNSAPNQTGATMGSTYKLMPTELLRAATNGDERVLTQLIGLQQEGELRSLDSVLEITEECNQNEAPIDAHQQFENLQSSTRMGSTVLHVLASNGHAELARKTYLKDAFLLKPATVTGDTPLHCAARYGHAQVISELTRGATDLKEVLRCKNKAGETALHDAAKNGHVDAVAALMEGDVELAGVVNKNGESPLYLATLERRVDVVRLIVELLCNRVITRAYYGGPEGRTALHVAVFGSEGLLLTRELLKLKTHNCERTDDGEPISLAEIADVFGSTPLHYATLSAWPDAVIELFDHDASLAYRDDSFGLFPIHVAALANYISYPINTFNVFLERYPDSGELVDRRGRNFLHIAVDAGNSIFLRKLYDYHMGKDSPTKNKDSPTKKMIKKAINARDNEGNTPFCLANFREEHMVKAFKKMLSWVDINACEKIRLGEHYYVVLSSDIPTGEVPVLIRKSLSDKTCIEEAEAENAEKNMYKHYAKIRKLHYLGANAGGIYSIDEIISSELRREKEISQRIREDSQLIGLAAVLVATVAFTAAFTLPGAYKPDGTPVLGRRYVFKSFLVADTIALLTAFACTVFLVLDLGQRRDFYSDRYWFLKLASLKWRVTYMRLPRYLFAISTIFMILAFGVGLYGVLAPIGNGFSITLLVLVLSVLPVLILAQLFNEMLEERDKRAIVKPIRSLIRSPMKLMQLLRSPLLLFFVFVLMLVLVFSFAKIG